MPSPAAESAREGPSVATRHRGLMARTVLVSALTFLSRLLGFVREALMAAIFGDGSAISDAFITAWRAPNLFRRLLGEGALSTALQSAMTQADAERGDSAGRAVFLLTARWLTWTLLIVTLVGMGIAWALPDEAPFLGGQWLGPQPEAVRDLTIRLLPFVLLVCLAAVCGGALAVRGHFAIPNLAPTLLNLVWIGTLAWIGWRSDWGRQVGTDEEHLVSQWDLARFLAWGLLFGGLVQLLVHLPPLARHRLLGSVLPEAELRQRLVRILKDTAPLAFGAAIYQINVFIDGLMAQGLLATGGSFALYNANRVQQFPMALVATAAVSAVFPSLLAFAHTGQQGRVRALHDHTQAGMLFLTLPAAVGMFALALPIASVCYEHNNYGLEGTQRVAEGLRCLAFALVPAGAAALASRVYVALGDLRMLLRIALWTLVLNVGLNALLVAGLGLDVAGLTVSTAATSWLNLWWLGRGFQTRLGLPQADPSLPRRFAKIALASALAALAAYGVHRGVAAWLGALEPRRSIPALLAGIGAACLAYGIVGRALHIEEQAEILRRIRSRFRASG